MKKNFTPHYDYFTNGKNIVVAVTHYAGKPVRGVARLDPRDEFDLETGKRIAKARCELKVANKRIQKGKIRRLENEILRDKLWDEWQRASEYLDDAFLDRANAELELNKIFAEG